MFVTVEGQCFVNIWRLKFDICAVPDTSSYCDIDH